MWKTTVRGLGPRYRCVTFDLPGHGESAKPDVGWYSIPRLSSIVFELCADLSIERPVLIGHSMGGTIALDLAASCGFHPDRVVAVNPMVTGRLSASHVWLDRGFVAPFLAISRGVWPLASHLLSHPPEFVSGRWTEVRRRQQDDLARTTPDSALGCIRAVATHDLRGRLSAIRVPTLIVTGERDRIVPPEEGRLAAEAISRGKLLRLPTGHHPSDEAPEQYLEAITAFLGERVAV